MTLLNAYIRDNIVANAIKKAGVNDREEKLIERRAKWANDVRLYCLGGVEGEKQIHAAIKKIKKILESLPKGVKDSSVDYVSRHAFSFSNRMRINVSGLSVQIFHNGAMDYDSGRKSDDKLISPKDMVLKDGNPLIQEFHDFTKEEQEIDELRLTVSAQVRAAVKSVRTVEKLLEQWPECAELLPAEQQKAVAPGLPAIRPQELNDLVGLPSEG